MTNSVFLKSPESYVRNIRPIQHYVHQSALYLSIMTGDPYSVCEAFVLDSIRGKKFPTMRDPVVKYYERGDNGDRTAKDSTLNQYITSLIADNQLLAPTMTTYVHPSVHRSVLSGIVKNNVKMRSIAKKAAHVAKAAGDTDQYIVKNIEQDNKKRKNNSMSGAFVAKGSVLNNPSAHSTLTSTTRCVSSFNNASNERIISGSRHYWSSDIALANIISIVANTDYTLLTKVLDKYNLVEPSVDDVMDCITYSSDLYWRDLKKLGHIRDFVSRLDGIQRAAFVYTGDMYHIRKYNDKFMRTFIRRLSSMVGTPADNALERIKTIDEPILNLAHHICLEKVKGLGRDYNKMHELGILDTLVSTSDNIKSTIEDYRDFIEVFFLSMNLPPSIAYIPTMIRRSVGVSDTDSTCFSTDEWVSWYYSKMEISNRAMAVAASVMYIATQVIAHNLAIFSANINVERDHLHTLAAKGEYTWDINLLTNLSKHYASHTVVQEANVFKEPEIDIKGIHLKSQVVGQRVRNHSNDLIKHIFDTLIKGEYISLVYILRSVADLERLINKSLLDGELEFYKQLQIKDASAYAREQNDSPYSWYIWWKEVMEPKYGYIDPPPFHCIKIPTKLNNRTAIKEWLSSTHVDDEFKHRMHTWVLKKNKTTLPTIYLPSIFVRSFGMPAEIRPIVDTKRIILDLTGAQRIILESLGYSIKTGWLVSEIGF